MPINKDLMVLRIEERFKQMFSQVPVSLSGGCLYWAGATHKELSLHGLKPRIKAGWMNWPIVPKHLDDGVCSTHFSYEFEAGDPMMNFFSMAAGNLPEMHVWVQLIDTNEIVDLSTRSLQEQCAKLPGTSCNGRLRHHPGIYGRIHCRRIHTTAKHAGNEDCIAGIEITSTTRSSNGLEL